MLSPLRHPFPRQIEQKLHLKLANFTLKDTGKGKTWKQGYEVIPKHQTGVENEVRLRT